METVVRYRKKRGDRLEVGIHPELKQLLLQAVDESGKTLSDFVQDAIAMKLKNWDAPAEFITSRREKQGKVQTSLFDPIACHESGFPLKWTDNPKAEIGYALQDGELMEVMQKAWSVWGLGEYTEAHLQETLRWYRAQKKGVRK